MNFTDEFEYVASDGNTYHIQVEGSQWSEQGRLFTELNNVTIFTDSGEIIDQDDNSVVFDECYNEAREHEYEVEEHAANFDYYETQLGSYYKNA